LVRCFSPPADVIAALTDFRPLEPQRATLFWATPHGTVSDCHPAQQGLYKLIETFMWGVAIFTLVGLLWASANTEVLRALPLS